MHSVGSVVCCARVSSGERARKTRGAAKDEKECIMSHPVIDTDECIGCGICVDACPQEVLEVVDGAADAVNDEACIGCGDCLEECPMGAIQEIAED